MSDPKDTPLRPPQEDPWGPGQMDDGRIDCFPESELAARQAQRDAEEAAFDAVTDDGDDDLRAAYEATGEVGETE
jgi:hypothetical protein